MSSSLWVRLWSHFIHNHSLCTNDKTVQTLVLFAEDWWCHKGYASYATYYLNLYSFGENSNVNIIFKYRRLQPSCDSWLAVGAVSMELSCECGGVSVVAASCDWAGEDEGEGVVWWDGPLPPRRAKRFRRICKHASSQRIHTQYTGCIAVHDAEAFLAINIALTHLNKQYLP